MFTEKKRSISRLAVFAGFATGVIVGFMLSPIKNGVGNNSGNTTHYHYGMESIQEDTERCETGTCEGQTEIENSEAEEE